MPNVVPKICAISHGFFLAAREITGYLMGAQRTTAKTGSGDR